MKKRILALAMAMAMVFGATTAVSAATITIDNAVTGQTYTAYKLFSVSSNGNGAVSYYMTADEYAAYGADVEAAGANCGLTLAESADGTRYNVVIGDNFNATTFAANMNASKGKITKYSSLKAESEEVVFSQLDDGYYLVDSSLGAVCAALDTADTDVEIIEKNEKPDVDKVLGDSDPVYAIGQSVDFVVTVKAGGAADTSYVVTDTMTPGLDFNNDITVKIGEETVAATNYTVVPADHGFTLTFPVEYTSTLAAKTELTITYSAKINEDAIVNATSNSVVLKYGDSTSVDDEKVTVYTGSITVDKYDGNSQAKLADAQFVVMQDGKYLAQDDNKVVSWVDSLDDATVITTDRNGSAKIEGLDNGTYTLREIAAPAGYNLLTEDVEFVIGDMENNTTIHATSAVANFAGSMLPSTGGIGTTVFYVIGGILVVGAGVVLVSKKRLSK